MPLTAPLVPVPAHVSWTGAEAPWTGRWGRRQITGAGANDPRITFALGRLEERWARRTGPAPHGNGSAPALRLNVGISPLADAWRADESYRLEVGEAGVLVAAASSEGALRALATLTQLLVPAPHGEGAGWRLPGVRIEDAPRFPWRGLMLDVCRHWQPLEVIERNLDAMELVKLNVLHLHLTDDQGFRVGSRTHPELARDGSDGKYFTPEQLRRIVARAHDRGIRVVPEFDLPGHATSWAVSHPELASGPGPYLLQRRWGIFDPVLDPTNPALYALLDEFLGEMAGIFPDPHVHLGGDENNGRQWDANPRIQAFRREHGLAGNEALQAYFNRRVAAILQRHGKRLVGWDEVLNPELPPGAVIQSWRGAGGVAAAVQAGFPVLLSHGYYLDHCWSAAEHYANDPLPPGSGFSPQEEARVLGGEAAMWSEWVSADTIDSRLWPRAAAVAERLWSSASVRDAADFYRRLDAISPQLAEAGARHLSEPGALATRIATDLGDPSLAPAVLTLASAFTPLGVQDRGKAQRNFDQSTPLTTFADLAVPDPDAARRFATPAGRRAQREDWRAAAKAVAAAANGRWADGREAAAVLLEACNLSEALESGRVPADATAVLARLGGVHAATRLAVLPTLQALIAPPLTPQP